MLLAADQAFEWVRSKVVGSAASADRHARAIVALEKWIGIYREQRVQELVLGYRRVLEAFDIYYGTLHFVLPPMALIVLWRWRPMRYARWRDTLVIASLLALAVFAVYPVAPPRLMPPPFNFTDTMRTVGGLGPLDAGRFKDTNPFAAMPSLHLTWATWCAFALSIASRRRWLRAAAILYPAATLFVVVATANHWFLDVVGGWVVLGAGWVLAGLIEQLRAHHPARAPSGTGGGGTGGGGRGRAR